MFKTTLKSVAVALSILAAVLTALTVADGVRNVSATAKSTSIKVTVVDLDGIAVHNAEVTVEGKSFFTDNKGVSPSIDIETLSNCYDSAVSEWGTVTVQVAAEGFVPSFVFNCVVYRDDTRRLTVRLYPSDGSELPYVCYVESPPDDYVRGLFEKG